MPGGGGEVGGRAVDIGCGEGYVCEEEEGLVRGGCGYGCGKGGEGEEGEDNGGGLGEGFHGLDDEKGWCKVRKRINERVRIGIFLKEKFKGFIE